MSGYPREIKVDDLKKDEPIYVMASAGEGKTAGDINLTLHRDGGAATLVLIPKTFIPICVTDFAPARLFIDSIDFRKMVASGFIRIISREDAEKILDTPDGRKELERVRKELFSGVSFQDRNDATPLEVMDTVDDKVSLRVKDIMMRTDINDDGKLNQLRAEQPYLKGDDYKFILTTTDDKSPITKWAKSNMTTDANNILMPEVR